MLSPERNGGFSQADAARLYSPALTDPVFGHQSVNVEAQLRTSNSLLHWMRRMIALRKEYSVFGRGDITFLQPENPAILAYIRTYKGQQMLIVNNLSHNSQLVTLALSEYAGVSPVEVAGGTSVPAITSEPYPLTLAPYGYYWLDLGRPRT